MHKPTRTRDQYMDYLFSCFFWEAPWRGQEFGKLIEKNAHQISLCPKHIQNVPGIISPPINCLFHPFFIGMVHLSTKFTKDMLPYWYKRMYDGDPGTFKRGRAGQSIVYKHQDVFILGHLEHDRYQPILNISVMPWSTKNLAPSIWHQLYLQTVREREAQPYNKGGSAWSKPGPILVTVLVSILVFNSFCFVI